MPAFNAEGTIRNAIGSILDQTEKNWELIIVNDGSTDGTEQEIARFDDPRIKYHRFQENRGIVTARNFGNALAKSKWIAMQDADDFSMPNRLEVCHRLIEAEDIDVIIHGVYTNMYDDKNDRMKRTYTTPPRYIRNRILKEQYLPGVCLFRKSLWERNPFREETKHAFDWMMHIDWSMNGARYEDWDEGLYEYVRHANSSSIRYENEGKRAQAFDLINGIIAKEYAAR